MIRVCFVSDAAFLGGAERYISLLAGGLDRSAFDVSLVARSDADESVSGWCGELADGGMTVARVPMRAPFRPLDLFGIRRAIAGTKPDVVHVNLPGPYDGQCSLVAPVARLAGARAVVTTEHLPMVEYLWKRALVKRVAAVWVDRVLTVSHANVRYLVERQSIPGERIRVVPNAIGRDFGARVPPREVTRDRAGIPRDAVVVVFLGNLLEHKGLARAARALTQIPSLPWHLLVIGSGPDGEAARRHLQEEGLEMRATFAGVLSAADVEAHLACADLLTLPSRIEGMPYVLLEAMACRLPVVSTRVYGIPEVVVDGESGVLVPPDDVAALRDALARVIGDPALRARMGERGRERFERHFTLERQVDAIADVYREVLTR
jgi:glycosyltransferase involved in cell wall biosynthesis